MKRIYLTFILSLLSFQITNAQAPTIEWQNTIGGSKNEEVWSVLQTTDGGYILGGYSASGISGDKTEANNGNSNDIDIWIVKLDYCTGKIVWQNTIGGNNGDFLYSMQQTTDGGYILGGYSYSGISGDKTEEHKGDFDYWVIKLDSFGNIVWDKTIGGNDSDNLFSIQQTADGGYIMGGDSRSGLSGDKTETNQGPNDYWVVKLDDTGTLEWENTIGGNGWDYLRSIQQTEDGGYILGGWSRSGISGDKTEESFEYHDYWIVKLDDTGQTIEWQNTIGGDKDDILYSIQQTTDGGYILGGWSQSGISGDKSETNQGSDYWIVKLDGTGQTIEWQNTIGGDSYDYMRSIQQTEDGGYILGGYSESGLSGDKTEANQGGGDYWIVKLDGIGNVVWDKTIGGDNGDIVTSIKQTVDGGYILSGMSSSGISGDKTEKSQGGLDYWIVKLAGERLPKTIHIPQDYSTIQEGINASVNCDTVLVQPGVYYENINFDGKNIVLGSLFLTTNDTSHISNTIIDGGNMDRVVTINNGESNSTLLTGFTIRNGGSIEPAYNKNGGGIYCANSSPMFTHLIIKDNNVNARGGGIFLTGYFGSINNVTINNNIASNDGGAIYANSSDFTISESSISHNISGGNGGGIYIQDCVEVNLNSLVIFNNQTAAFDGGGICIENVSKTNIIQSTITGNSVPNNRYGGGIVISNIFSVVNIVNSIIYGNFNGPDYEAIILWSGQVNSNYSCILGLVDGGTRWPGEGMIYEDPNFESISDNNYYLSETSPCIETGTNFYLLNGDTLINYLSNQYIGAAPDMGYFESPYLKVHPGDTDNNGKVEANDILPIGIYFLLEGVQRDSIANDWIPKTVLKWDSLSTSYADANGDGIIDERDIISIGVNWGNNHNMESPNLSLNTSNINQHKDSFYKIYNSLTGDSEAVKSMKQLLREILDIHIPLQFQLYDNYPNPFNNSTILKFDLPISELITIKIFNILGQEVSIPISERLFSEGSHSIHLNLSNLSAGIYYYQIKTDTFTQTKKMALVK